MYLQFKQGFVEVDRWDGTRIDDGDIAVGVHQQAIDAAINADVAARDGSVMIVRSRSQSTIRWVSRQTSRFPVIFRCPDSWDYRWRCYLTVNEWSQILARIAQECDYRNFKNWTHDKSTAAEERVAHGIWQVVQDAYKPRGAAWQDQALERFKESSRDDLPSDSRKKSPSK